MTKKITVEEWILMRVQTLKDIQHFLEEYDINASTKTGWTLLQKFACAGNLKIIKYLVKKDVNLNYQNSAGATALHWAYYYDHADVIEFLIEHNADMNIEDKYGKRPFHYAKNDKIKKYLESVNVV